MFFQKVVRLNPNAIQLGICFQGRAALDRKSENEKTVPQPSEATKQALLRVSRKAILEGFCSVPLPLNQCVVAIEQIQQGLGTPLIEKSSFVFQIACTRPALD